MDGRESADSDAGVAAVAAVTGRDCDMLDSERLPKLELLLGDSSMAINSAVPPRALLKLGSESGCSKFNNTTGLDKKREIKSKKKRENKTESTKENNRSSNDRRRWVLRLIRSHAGHGGRADRSGIVIGMKRGDGGGRAGAVLCRDRACLRSGLGRRHG